MEEQSLTTYLKDIRNLGIESGDEQLRLVVLAKGGCQKSRDNLVKSNLRFVISVAKEYDSQNHDLSLNDLVNEGNYGLIKSIDKFDPFRGIKFISYAVWWIRQSMLEAIGQNGTAIRLPANKKNSINKINKAVEHLSKNQGQPTSKQLQQHLKKQGLMMKTSEIDVHLCYSTDCQSIESQIGDDEGDTIKDRLRSEDKPMDEELNDRYVREELIKSLESTLNKKEIKIINMFFGLNGEAVNLKDIGKKMGITNERVRQIKDQALVKMRGFENKNLRKLLRTEI